MTDRISHHLPTDSGLPRPTRTPVQAVNLDTAEGMLAALSAGAEYNAQRRAARLAADTRRAALVALPLPVTVDGVDEVTLAAFIADRKVIYGVSTLGTAAYITLRGVGIDEDCKVFDYAYWVGAVIAADENGVTVEASEKFKAKLTEWSAKHPGAGAVPVTDPAGMLAALLGTPKGKGKKGKAE